MSSVSSLSLLLLLSITTSLLVISHAKDSFTAELIHRDSPKSPFYNPNLTLSERFEAAVNRSLIRSCSFGRQERLTSMSADLTSNGWGEYMMKIGIGTPPVDVLGFADTGSSLIWTQCEPCTKCIRQPNPLFNPKVSATYRLLKCSWTQCSDLSPITSCGEGGACVYKEAFVDGSYTQGNIATESIKIGTSKILSVIFGCGYQNSLHASGSAGVIGLDLGEGSLVSHLGPAISGVFSYCLSPIFSNRRSSISFGVVSGPGPYGVTTPLSKKPGSDRYQLTLEAVSVDGTRLEFPGSAYGGANEGNMNIDSGTTLTFLPMDFYNQVVAEVDKVMNAEKVDMGKKGLSLCYRAAGNDVILPEIRMHFKGGDLRLKIQRDTVCFSFIGSPADSAIFGNMGQSDFAVEYDRNAGTVSFAPRECN
ncbi:PREDICTED: aspartic proteinase CDR1-like [Tarenaya hassleriana]|uniref:aspartic proteinase CDR1-like n=1 Tax=Tarenaya hassleriana TaxID=28532 RepID=UPI00053C9EFC|nr:PREDICTED: aspartic proteinase CDR1-like [Tarenaya hassleriana]